MVRLLSCSQDTTAAFITSHIVFFPSQLPFIRLFKKPCSIAPLLFCICYKIYFFSTFAHFLSMYPTMHTPHSVRLPIAIPLTWIHSWVGWANYWSALIIFAVILHLGVFRSWGTGMQPDSVLTRKLHSQEKAVKSRVLSSRWLFSRLSMFWTGQSTSSEDNRAVGRELWLCACWKQEDGSILRLTC